MLHPYLMIDSLLLMKQGGRGEGGRRKIAPSSPLRIPHSPFPNLRDRKNIRIRHRQTY